MSNNLDCVSRIRYRHQPLSLRFGIGFVVILISLWFHRESEASCRLEPAAYSQIRGLKNPAVVRAWSLQFTKSRVSSCTVCHVGGRPGPRNEYGTALNALLTLEDRRDPARMREAGRRVNGILANPSVADSPTFGELLERGVMPSASFTTGFPPRMGVPERVPENITLEGARNLVQQAEAQSSWGILQLSDTYEMAPEVAEVLAEFRGEMLILGLKSLTPEVAVALAKSRADTVWLHSVTSVSPEAAAAITRLPGHLLLTGLTKLDSVPLAEKLTERPGALSLPYVSEISVEIATALGKNPRSLAVTGVLDFSPEVQDALAGAAGGVYLPNLTSLDSMALTRKLASQASAILLPYVTELPMEQAEEIASAQRPFLGSKLLNVRTMTPEVAAVFAESAERSSLVLTGSGSLSDAALEALVGSELKIELQDIASFTPEQLDIVTEGLAGRSRAKPWMPEFILPSLRRLDSAPLAETLLRLSPVLYGVTSISPQAAEALGNQPSDAELRAANPWARVPALSVPSLEELTPETARLLTKRSWSSISLPALQDITPETLRILVRKTTQLTLGLTEMPPELAPVFGEMASNDTSLGGGILTLPYLGDLSPPTARALVNALNRGEALANGGRTKVSRSPQLYLGDRGEGTFDRVSPPLTPPLAAELAKYQGLLSLAGIHQLSPETAAELAAFRGPSLILSGPAVDRLPPAAAASLASIPGTLQVSTRDIDSVPLAGKIAGQTKWSLSRLETVSAAAAPAIVGYRQFFKPQTLTELESPLLARRLISGPGSGAVALPVLTTLSAEAAEVLATRADPIILGLRALNSADVARALTKAPKGVQLTRLRAATPEVIEILEESPSIKTPPLDTLYRLPRSAVLR